VVALQTRDDPHPIVAEIISACVVNIGELVSLITIHHYLLSVLNVLFFSDHDARR
jgi:hypothetical protein